MSNMAAASLANARTISGETFFLILILYNGFVLVLWRSLLTKNDQMAYFFEAISKLN